MPEKKPIIFPSVLGAEFDQAIEYIRKSSIGTPKKLFIDLSVAHQDLKFDITGNFFYVVDSGGINDIFDIKFNEQREPPFTLSRMMGFYTPFYRFYITNAAQVGASVTIIYGTLSRPFLDIIDNRSEATTNSLLEDIKEKLNQDAPMADEDRVVKYDAAAPGVTTIIHTVTAGKSLYLAGCELDVYHSGAGTGGRLFVRDAVDALQYIILNHYGLVANERGSDTINLAPALVIPAGWDICVSSSALANSNAFIQGWEE